MWTTSEIVDALAIHRERANNWMIEQLIIINESDDKEIDVDE